MRQGHGVGILTWKGSRDWSQVSLVFNKGMTVKSFVYLFIFETFSCSTSRHLTYCVAKEDLELLILLSACIVMPCLSSAYNQPQDFYLLGKCSTN